MKKIGLKLIFMLNILIYWFIFYKIVGYFFEHVLSDIFVDSVISLNIVFIISIFVFLLPLSMILTHQVFKYIRKNYNYYVS